jgi:hypothetical protein
MIGITCIGPKLTSGNRIEEVQGEEEIESIVRRRRKIRMIYCKTVELPASGERHRGIKGLRWWSKMLKVSLQI